MYIRSENKTTRKKVEKKNKMKFTSNSSMELTVSENYIYTIYNIYIVYNAIWEGNGVLKHNILYKIVCSLLSLYSDFSLLDVLAADIFHRSTHFL